MGPATPHNRALRGDHFKHPTPGASRCTQAGNKMEAEIDPRAAFQLRNPKVPALEQAAPLGGREFRVADGSG
jgi:hypothetical protein